MKAFMTGSRVYGTPDPGSDLDMVVLVTKDEEDMLKTVSWRCGVCCGTGASQTGQGPICKVCQGSGQLFHRGGSHGCSIELGGLDVIAFTDEGLFNVWYKATEFLKKKAPVPRAKAVDYIAKKVAKYNASIVPF